ncbi:DUF2924 domain-containing protein [uncultured Sphingomonas sp.]|uniref:DUF2924 domain-containing protein n=1 Tax=uncultured Sphingomonas sp. TaxID=158754 RepID=UPI0035CAEC68
MSKVDQQLAELATLSRLELRTRWAELTDGAPRPRMSPALLRLALAWEIQARAGGGLSRATQQQLAQLAAAKTRTAAVQPGMRLVREWQGRVHVVTAEPGAGGQDPVIRWDDRTWRSLSEVARAISGRWSGPAFFGLKWKLAP